jgi:hypothetical protein
MGKELLPTAVAFVVHFPPCLLKIGDVLARKVFSHMASAANVNRVRFAGNKLSQSLSNCSVAEHGQ